MHACLGAASGLPRGCLAGARLYAATAVFGDDAAQWHHFRRVLRNFDDLLHARGTNVALVIAATDTPPATVVGEPGWRLAREVRWRGREDRNLLMAHYREDALASIAAGLHDDYLIVEADVDLRAWQVEALCVEHALLGASNTTYAPGLLRVEKGVGGVHSLVDLHIGRGCGARRVLVQDRPYATVRSCSSVCPSVRLSVCASVRFRRAVHCPFWKVELLR